MSRIVEACYIFDGEFDPGSGQTLAACITHASRTSVETHEWRTGEEHVGTCLVLGNTRGKLRLIPHEIAQARKDFGRHERGLRPIRLVGVVRAHLGDDR